MQYVTDNAEYEKVISAGKKLVDFYADWCGPCKMLSPILEEIDKEYADIEVVKVNVDTLSEPAVALGIDSIPALILYENGEIKNKIIGYLPKEMLKAKLGI